MSIHIFLGKPGSGKSLYGVQFGVTQLRETNRNWVTNLPLRPDRLNEYLQQKYPLENLRLLERLQVLTDDELREFWKYRGPGEGKEGVCYILDEAHIAFNAREWATLGRGALHYLSQHRKLGDVVVPITQSPGNLDKQFRSVAEDFTVLRNEYTAKFGMFRGRGRFVRRTYLQEPQQNAEPFEVASFTLDAKGIASCYDTAKGIGVHGSKADIGRRAKGIPIWTVIPAALVLAVMCVALPYFLGRGASKFLTKGAPKPSQASNGTIATAAVPGLFPQKRIENAAAGELRPQEKPIEREKYAIEPDASPANSLYVSGYIVRNQRVNVVLSDGRVLTEGDGLLARVSRAFVDLTDGRRLWLRQPREARVSAPRALSAPPPLPLKDSVEVEGSKS